MDNRSFQTVLVRGMAFVAAPDFPPISVYLYLSLDLSDRAFLLQQITANTMCYCKCYFRRL